MADRRTDDTPLAPPRSLAGPKGQQQSAQGGPDGPKKPLSERVSAALASASENAKGAAKRAPASTEATTSVPSPPPGQPRGTGQGAPVPRPRATRKARLRMTHVDPWSVMKIAFLLSVAFGIVTVVAVGVVWSVLGAAGVWESINSTVQEVLGGDSARTFDVENYIGMSRVLGFTMIVAVVDVLLITAIATLGAFLYNLAAALLGGLEVTLAEDER
jgi:hypothetical protein